MEPTKNKYLEKIAGVNWEKALTLAKKNPATFGLGAALGADGLVSTTRNKNESRGRFHLRQIRNTIAGAATGAVAGKGLELLYDQVKTAEAAPTNKPVEAGTDAVIGAGILGTGFVSAKNNYHAGNITGRESLYHGTTTENSKNILREGLKPGGRGISQMVDKVKGKDVTGHNSHVFMTRDKIQGASYAVQASKLSKTPEEEVIKRMKEGQGAVHVPPHEVIKARLGKFEGASILRANVPTWKKEMDSVVNPEWTHMKDHPHLGYILNPRGHDYLFRDSVYTRKGNIPSKYFQGAADYERNSVNEISQFIKNNPGRFLKGVGGAAAAVGAGGLFLHNAYKNFKGSNTEGQQKQASFIRKVPIDKTLTRRIQNLLKSKAKRLDRLSNYGKYVGGAVGGAVGYKATDSKDFSTGDRILTAGIGGALGAGAGNEIAKRLATKLKHRNLIKTIGRAPGILERLKEIRPLKRPGVQDEYHDLMAKVMKRD